MPGDSAGRIPSSAWPQVSYFFLGSLYQNVAGVLLLSKKAEAMLGAVGHSTRNHRII